MSFTLVGFVKDICQIRISQKAIIYIDVVLIALARKPNEKARYN
jgi:hypothetical protein